MDFFNLSSLTDISAIAQQLQPLLNWSKLPLDLPSLVALAVGIGWASGLRLYALIFVLGALGKFAGVTLPGGLVVLTEPVVVGISGFLLFIEFFADKIPWLDSVWDGIHTFIRIPAGAALAAAVMGGEGQAWQVAMALIGGTIAAGTHFAKTTTRAAINTTPEPFTNIVTSVAEEGIFIGGMWLLLNQPLIFLILLILFMILAVVLIIIMWKFLRIIFTKIVALINKKSNSVEINTG